MPGGKRLWRTEDGRLVEDGHPDAVLLAYGPDDELSDEDQGGKSAKTKEPAPEKVEDATTAKPTGRGIRKKS